MTKRTRTILFSFFVSLFLVAAPLLVLHSQGYRFDLESKRIVRTGGLYFKVSPKVAEIKVNGEDSRKTGYLTGSLLRDNLIPGSYNVLIEKEGYHSWEKTLEVAGKMVTEAKDVLLVPEQPDFKDLFEEAKNFILSPDGKKMLVETEGEEGWSLKLYEPETGIKSRLMEEKDFFLKGADFLGFEFDESSGKVRLSVATEEQVKSYVFSLDRLPISLAEEEIIDLPGVLASKTVEGQTYSLDALGYVNKKGSSSEETRLNKEPFLVKQETEYEIWAMKDNVFLKEGSELFWLKPQADSFELIFSGISGIKASPDSEKALLCSASEIWVLFLKERTEQPQKKTGDKAFMTRVSSEIKDASWLDSSHFFFIAGDSIRISETDDRNKVNIVELASFNDPQISWSYSGKKIYVLTEGVLKESKTLIP
jgi:hypothetical protein